MISGSHCSEYNDGCLLGCSEVLFGTDVSEVPVSLIMKVSSTSQALVNFYQTIRCYNQKTAVFKMYEIVVGMGTRYKKSRKGRLTAVLD
jgi:hypothetical protein